MGRFFLVESAKSESASSHAKTKQINIYKSFSYFSRFTNLSHKLKYILLVCRKDIVDSISIISLL